MNADKEFDNIFIYHAPKADQEQRYAGIRANAKHMAEYIDGYCPQSKEKDIALERLQEAMFWANASIARNE